MSLPWGNILSYVPVVDEGERPTKFFCALETKKLSRQNHQKGTHGQKLDKNRSKRYFKSITNILQRAFQTPRCWAETLQH